MRRKITIKGMVEKPAGRPNKKAEKEEAEREALAQLQAFYVGLQERIKSRPDKATRDELSAGLKKAYNRGKEGDAATLDRLQKFETALAKEDASVADKEAGEKAKEVAPQAESPTESPVPTAEALQPVRADARDEDVAGGEKNNKRRGARVGNSLASLGALLPPEETEPPRATPPAEPPRAERDVAERTEKEDAGIKALEAARAQTFIFAEDDLALSEPRTSLKNVRASLRKQIFVRELVERGVPKDDADTLYHRELMRAKAEGVRAPADDRVDGEREEYKRRLQFEAMRTQSKKGGGGGREERAEKAPAAPPAQPQPARQERRARPEIKKTREAELRILQGLFDWVRAQGNLKSPERRIWSVKVQINVARDIVEHAVLHGKTTPEERWKKLPEKLAAKIKETIEAIQAVRRAGEERPAAEPQEPEPTAPAPSLDTGTPPAGSEATANKGVPPAAPLEPQYSATGTLIAPGTLIRSPEEEATNERLHALMEERRKLEDELAALQDLIIELMTKMARKPAPKNVMELSRESDEAEKRRGEITKQLNKMLNPEIVALREKLGLPPEAGVWERPFGTPPARIMPEPPEPELPQPEPAAAQEAPEAQAAEGPEDLIAKATTFEELYAAIAEHARKKGLVPALLIDKIRQLETETRHKPRPRKADLEAAKIPPYLQEKVFEFLTQEFLDYIIDRADRELRSAAKEILDVDLLRVYSKVGLSYMIDGAKELQGEVEKDSPQWKHIESVIGYLQTALDTINLRIDDLERRRAAMIEAERQARGAAAAAPASTKAQPAAQAPAEATPPVPAENVPDLSGRPPERDAAGELEIRKPSEPVGGEMEPGKPWWRRIWPFGAKKSAETAKRPAAAPHVPAAEAAKAARAEFERKREADPVHQALRELGLAEDEIEVGYGLVEGGAPVGVFDFLSDYNKGVKGIPAERRRKLSRRILLGEKTRGAIKRKTMRTGDDPVLGEIAVFMVEEILEGRDPSVPVIARKLKVWVEEPDQIMQGVMVTISRMIQTAYERLYTF